MTQLELPPAEYVLGLVQRLKDMSSILGKQRVIQQEFTAYPQLETIFYFALSDDFATHVGDVLYYRLRNRVEHAHVVNGEGTVTLTQACPLLRVYIMSLLVVSYQVMQKKRHYTNF